LYVIGISVRTCMWGRITSKYDRVWHMGPVVLLVSVVPGVGSGSELVDGFWLVADCSSDSLEASTSFATEKLFVSILSSKVKTAASGLIKPHTFPQG